MILKWPRFNLSELYVHAWCFPSQEDCLVLTFHVAYLLDAHLFEFMKVTSYLSVFPSIQFLCGLQVTCGMDIYSLQWPWIEGKDCWMWWTARAQAKGLWGVAGTAPLPARGLRRASCRMLHVHSR